MEWVNWGFKPTFQTQTFPWSTKYLLHLSFIIISLHKLVEWSSNAFFFYACKEKQGHLVEWVGKSSFTRLNKLFKIDKSKRTHLILLMENNLKTILEHPKSLVIPVFPQLTHSTLVPSKHFVLKDFPFYEVARLVYVEAWQALLDTCESAWFVLLCQWLPAHNCYLVLMSLKDWHFTS